jgi:uncharacterized cupredoxin-like copper-binding protein
MNKILWVLVFIIGALVLVGCSAADPAPVIDLEMNEFGFIPEEIELKVGQVVTLKMVNVGEIEHEFMVGREVVFDGIQPAGYVHDMFEGVEPVVTYSEHGHEDGEADDHHDEDEVEDHHEEGEDHHDDDVAEDHHDDDHEHHGFMVLLAGTEDAEGATEASIQFTVTEEMVGNWEIGCFLEDGGHYDEGMIGTLVVKP